MPRNVLMIGNSHSAAPRIALRDDPGRWPDFCPEVVAMPGDTLRGLELRDATLVPKTAELRGKMLHYNGIPDLPLAEYDAFVVIGGLGFHRMAEPGLTHPAPDFPSVAPGGALQGGALVSTGFIDAVMAHHIAGSTALRMIRGLAGLGQGPVLFMDQPFPSLDCRADPQNFAGLVTLAARGDAGALYARFLQLLARALPKGARHLPQPAPTVREQVFTAPEWMRGSVRMQPRRDVPHEATEYGHANPAYGGLQIDMISQAFAAL